MTNTLSMALLREWHLADERFDLEDWSRRVRNLIEDAPATQAPSKKLVDRLRGWYHNDDISTGDTVLLIGEAAGEIERLQRECSNWKQLHDNDEACIANLRASGAPKPPHLREPPHCKNCSCGMEE